LDRITDVSRDCFDALIQLRRANEASLPSPAALHARLRGFVDALYAKAADAGFGREEASDIAYAVVALADEIVMSRSDSLREYWAGQSLQMHYFHENVAGESFFTRLQAVRSDPRRREILQVYNLALLFGFEGRYRVRGGELELLRLTEEIQRELARGRRFDAELLSPQGERPDDPARVRARGALPVWIAAGALATLLFLYVGLKVSLDSSTSAVAARVASSGAR
jgi:type VI secretion system protein ImpK